MLIAIAAAGVLFAQAAAEPPKPAEPSAAAAPAPKAKKPKPKLICTEEAQVGSVIPKRVCRTPEEAEADRAAAQRNTDNLMDRLRVCQGATC